MGRGIFEKLLQELASKGESLPDNRQTGRNFRYKLSDILKCAFGVFFFQHPSLLDFQRKMQEQRRRNNMASIFKVNEIPGDTQIRNILDGIAPEQFGGVFNDSLKIAEEHSVLETFRVLDEGVLLALDGVWYHSSENISCKHCLKKTTVDKKTKEEKTTYYHTILAGTIVRPGKTEVLPVMGEFIRNEDGSEKQDCEHKAARRWLLKHAEEYRWLKPTLLGDDLFSNQPFCEAVLQQKMSFLFTCKPLSHPWLTETLENSYLEEKVERKWTGTYNQRSTYRWINGVPLRDSKDALLVNYLYMQIRNEKTGKVMYTGSWVTDKTVTAENIEHLALCARARWKIENEHNNVLKNHGYNLEHNFGHGQEYASEMYCLLNLLAFLFHGILSYADDLYGRANKRHGRRTEFFIHLRTGLWYVLHESWDNFLLCVAGEEPG
jgi:hypothetical protein